MSERSLAGDDAPTGEQVAALWGLITQYWVPRALYVATALGIPDLLKQGPRTSEDLAAASGAHPDRLYRILRALTAVGVFAEEEGRRFRQTPLSALLRDDVDPTFRPAVMHLGRQEFWAVWGNLLEAVRSGRPAFDITYGAPSFDYQASHPDYASTFNRFMATGPGRHRAVAAAYDFSRASTIVDVGGGHGRILAEILRRHPNARGILFDVEHVVAGSGPVLAEAGVTTRCRVSAGSFFDFVPEGGDLYVVSQILHDWDDDRCHRILVNCRRAMSEHARLLLVELVLPARGAEPITAFMDLNMMASLTGKERTEAEFAALLRGAGLRLERVLPTRAPQRILEATPV